MSLPESYKWLANEPGPKMLLEALKLLGTKEQPGSGDNPEILEWAAETKLNRVYSADSIPWCGLFMAVVAKRAGKEVPENPLWAQNWAKFGLKSYYGALGDVLVFKRPSGGHVGLYVGEDETAYHVLGGNQSDAVTVTRVAKDRCIGIRRPVYQTMPTNIRKINLSDHGGLSTNEG